MSKKTSFPSSFFLFKVLDGGGRYALLLDGIHLVRDAGGDGDGAGFHFYEVQPVRAFGDDVQLQMARTPVPVQDMVTARKQEIAGHLLSCIPNFAGSLNVHGQVTGFSPAAIAAKITPKIFVRTYIVQNYDDTLKKADEQRDFKQFYLWGSTFVHNFARFFKWIY